MWQLKGVCFQQHPPAPPRSGGSHKGEQKDNKVRDESSAPPQARSARKPSALTDADPCDPARVEGLDWFGPASPDVRAVQALRTWGGGERPKSLTHSSSTQAAILCLKDHAKMAAVDHVKPHVAQATTNAERVSESARSCALTTLDLHPTGEDGGEEGEK